MDLVKKRKLEENGSILDPTLTLTESDARSILEPITAEQLRDILTTAILTHPTILASVRDVADRDIARRKLFVRGLGSETISESLRSMFSSFGELEEAVVISDKGSGKSKGYGFVTYRHVDSAVLALKEPSKNIDGRISVAALASAGASSGGGSTDTMLRKIFVGNVAYDMSAERLLEVFSSFGEIEEGPVGFDKLTGKSKGYALIVYKTVDGAKMALSEPLKLVDGRQLVCRLASEGKKGKLGGDAAPPPSGPYSAPGGPAGEGGYPPYSGFNGIGQQTNNQMNPSYNSSVGGQGPGGYGGNAGFGSGGGYGGEPHYGGGPNPSSYGGYGGGPNSSGYGGGPNSSGYGGGLNSSGYGGGPNPSGYGGGPNPSGHGGYGGSGLGATGNGGAGRDGYGMQPNSGGPPSGGRYSDSAHYSLSAGGYSSQQHQPTGTSPAPRIPPGGAGGYPPPYY